MGRNREKLLDLLGCALIAWALGASLSLMLVRALALPVSAAPAMLGAAGAALAYALATWNRKGALAVGVIAAVLAVYALRSGGLDALRSLIEATYQVDEVGMAALGDHMAQATALLAGTIALLMFWMARMSGGAYPALLLSFIVVFGGWLLDNRIEPALAIMVVAALGAMFARAADDKVPYLRALPVALLAALLAIALLPGGRVTWPPLEQAAQKARDLFSDYFLFTEPRTTYSISADGFQPKGEALGGPVDPLPDEVMKVVTDRPLLLRGSIKRTYTSYSWTETAVNSRYVFIDPTRKALRDQVFDADRQPSFIESGAFARVGGRVTMLHEGISALFVPHGLYELNVPLDMPTYFSTGGEVFITRGVQPGDGYAFSAATPAENQALMRDLIARRAGRPDARDQAARQGYTQLPQGIEHDVYALAEQIVRGATSPYDAAIKIERHLMESYTYTTDMPYPPQGRDFVSYFLLDAKKGYCSYFASAMAVLGRIAGLPTRYVEGYLVPSRDGGETIVTGKNAHAWVEVYFDGVGWVTFNPTPGSGDSYRPGDSGGAGGDAHADDTENQDGDADAEPEPTPTPTPPPEGDEGQQEEQSEDQQDDQNEDQPEDQPEDDQSEDQPEDEPEDEPEDQPEDQPEDDRPDLSFLWWLLLLIPIAGAAAFAVRRLRSTDPRLGLGKRVKAEDRLMIWYRALLLALEHQGQAPAAGETPAQFAERLKAAGLVGDAFTEVAGCVMLSRYAGRKPDAQALEHAEAAYEALVRQLGPREKLRWALHRIFKGLGDPGQIP